MGYGAWDSNAYNAARTFRRARGVDDFAYSSDLADMPRDAWRAAAVMEPKGAGFRECRDSADHPNALPIVVLFDVTGSMGIVPRILQQKLGKLHGLLQRRGYAEDPQILFGAIGDADCDRVPLQVGQFESDNAMDEQLRSIFLEGGGGGQKSESYELAAYFVARHTVTDAWEKRGKKGHVFFIGDELNKPGLRAASIHDIIGDRVRDNINPASIYRELRKKWHVHYILPNQSYYYDDPEIADHWRGLLGQGFMKLDDPAAVCELIAVTIGMEEQTINLDEGLADLADVGSVTEAGSVGKALAGTGAGPGAAAAHPSPYL